MPNFGAAGKITARKRDIAVDLHSDHEEYLHFKVTVHGVTPILAFDCTHNRKLFTTSGKAVQTVYEWTLGKKILTGGIDNFTIDSNQDGYALGMEFTFAPIKYTYFVERLDKNNLQIALIKDVDFESTDPSDVFFEGLSVALI